MDFLNGILGEGNAWGVILSGLFGVLSLVLGVKWNKLKKELKEFGMAVVELIDLLLNMPDKPSSAYLRKVKKEAIEVGNEFKDIVAIFKKNKDGK